MHSRELWSRVLSIVGSIAMLLGAIDPMEGSLVILPGSALVALGAVIGRRERRLIIYWAWVFLLIASGVGAMVGLTAFGGIGGSSGHSMWWGLLVLPYLIGWSMAIWGPGGTPRWVPAAGIVVGLWYLVIPALTLLQRRAHPGRPVFPEALIVVGVLGLVTIGGCIFRLCRRVNEATASAARPPAAPAPTAP
jgi:hypothetical protein